MLDKFKELSLKEKIIYPIYIVLSLLIGVICILYFFKILDFDFLILFTGIALLLMCGLNLINVSYKENKKNFIINLIYLVVIVVIIIVTLLV